MTGFRKVSSIDVASAADGLDWSQINRRSLLIGGASATLALGLSVPAFAQSKINEVPIDKLMAKDGLKELSLGNKDAKVTIVEYASMSCPACANFHKTTYPKLKEKYVDTGKVRFIMREFPLNDLAAAGAMLARCADTPDKSIALIDVLFEQQRAWVSNNALAELTRISKQAGFTQDRFDKCLNDNELLDKLTKRRQRADKEFGVDATPSFFINGKRFRVRNFSISAFDEVLEPLLKNS